MKILSNFLVLFLRRVRLTATKVPYHNDTGTRMMCGFPLKITRTLLISFQLFFASLGTWYWIIYSYASYGLELYCDTDTEVVKYRDKSTVHCNTLYKFETRLL